MLLKTKRSSKVAIGGILCLLCSCAPFQTSIDIGFAFPVDTFHIAARIEKTFQDTPHTAMDHGIGPAIIPGWGVGIEHLIRLRYKLHPRVHPYLVVVNGALWSLSEDYIYTNSIGAGAQFNLRPELSITADYRLMHQITGKTFHSDKFRAAMGLTKSTKPRDYQNSAFFMGLIYTF